jgi:hypothetical protein
VKSTVTFPPTLFVVKMYQTVAELIVQKLSSVEELNVASVVVP